MKVYENNTLEAAMQNVDKKLNEFEDGVLGQQYIEERARALFPTNTPQDAIRRQRFREDKTLLLGKLLMDKGDATTGMQFFESAKTLGAEAKIKADDLILQHMDQEHRLDQRARADHNRVMGELRDQAHTEIYSNFKEGMSFDRQKDRIEALVKAGILSMSDENAFKNYWKQTEEEADFSSQGYITALNMIGNIRDRTDQNAVVDFIDSVGFKDGVKRTLLDKIYDKTQRQSAQEDSFYITRWGDMLRAANPAGQSIMNVQGDTSRSQNQFYLNEMISLYKRHTQGMDTAGKLKYIRELENNFIIGRFDKPIDMTAIPPLLREISGRSTVSNWEEYDEALEGLNSKLMSGEYDLQVLARESSILNFIGHGLNSNGVLRELQAPLTMEGRQTPEVPAPEVPAPEVPAPQAALETQWQSGEPSPEWNAMSQAGREYLTAVKAYTGSILESINKGDIGGIKDIDRSEVERTSQKFFDSARSFGLPIGGRKGLKDSVYAFNWQRDIAYILNDLPTAMNELYDWAQTAVEPVVQQLISAYSSVDSGGQKAAEKIQEQAIALRDYMVKDWEESMKLIRKNLGLIDKNNKLPKPKSQE
jgi:hypothetical protein